MLEAQYKLVNVMYPINVWVPRGFTDKQHPDWPNLKIIEKPLTVRLLGLPVENWEGSTWRFERSHLRLSVAMGSNELSLKLLVGDIIMDPLQMIPEVRSLMP